MEISQEDLDKKLEGAEAKGKKVGVEETESEQTTEIKKVKEEADERVEKAGKESSKKVSEQSEEIGSLRKWKKDNEEDVKEHGELKTKVKEFEAEEEKETKKREKEEEERNRDPAEKLKDMTEEEAKKIDTYVVSDKCPESIKKLVANGETQNRALADILDVMREGEPGEPVKNPASKWLQSKKETSVNDGKSVREIMQEELKNNDRQTQAVPGMPAAKRSPLSNGKPDTRSQAAQYSGSLGDYAKKKE